MTGPAANASVRFLGVPVQLYLALQQHNDAMLRELAFLTAAGNTPEAAELAQRLRSIVRAEHTEVAESRARMRDQVLTALERGETVVDLEDISEPLTADASMHYVDLLDEVDALCREGKLVLVASSPDVQRLRRWFATEMRDQTLHGAAPTPFDGATTRIGE
jgi:hypothetical protein